MALEDALVLSKLIASERDVTQVLDEYTTQRITRIRWVHEKTNRRDQIRNLPSIIRNFMTRYLANSVYRTNYSPLIAERAIREHLRGSLISTFVLSTCSIRLIWKPFSIERNSWFLIFHHKNRCYLKWLI